MKVCGLEVVPPPDPGLNTVTWKFPAFSRSEARIEAVSLFTETKVVLLFWPLNLTIELMMKLVPLTVKMMSWLPAVVELGFRLVIVGRGLVTVKAVEFDVPPLAPGLKTVMGYIPTFMRSDAGMVAVNLVAETKIVVLSWPLNLTFDVLMKLVPLTVSVNWLELTAFELGLREVMVGRELLVLVTEQVAIWLAETETLAQLSLVMDQPWLI